MKNRMIYSLVSLVSLVIGGGTAYALKGLEKNKADAAAKNQAHVQEETGFDKTINTLLSAKEMRAEEVNIRLSIPTYDDIHFKISNLDVDLSSMSDIKALQCKGSLNVRYGDAVNDNLHFIYENGGNLYLTYGSTGYTFHAPTTIDGVLSVLNTLNIKLPLSSTDASLDLSSLADKALAVLKDVPETKMPDGGYSYALNLDEAVKDLGLSGVRGNLYTDGDHALKAISLASDGIHYQDKLTIGLGVSGISLKKDNGYRTLTSEEKKRYTDLNNVNGVFSTLNRLVGEKKFKAGFSVDLKNQNQSVAIALTGDIRGDLSRAGSDYQKGCYQVNLKHVSGDETLNEASLYHEDGFTYLRLNQLIQGKIANTDVEDIFALLSAQTGKASIQDLSQDFAKIIAGSDLDKLIHNKDFSVYKNFIRSLRRENDGVVLTLSPKAFRLGGEEIEIHIACTQEGGLSALSISGFEYQGYQVNLTLDLEDYLGFETVDKAKYPDLHISVPLFHTVLDLAKQRKVSADYALTISDGEKNVAAGGTIDADLADFSKAGKKYGNYHLSLKMKENQSPLSSSSLDAYYQDQNLYVGYGEVLKNSIIGAELNDIFALFDNKSNTPVDGKTFAKIASALETIKNSVKLKNDLSKIKDSYSLKPLDSFLSISPVSDKQIDVTLNLAYLFEGTALLDQIKGVTLSLNSDDKSLLGLSLHDLHYQDKAIDFTLSLQKEYRQKEGRLTEEEKRAYAPISSASKFVSTFLNVPMQLRKFSFDVSGSVGKDDSQKTFLKANAAVDLSDLDHPNLEGKVTITLPPDQLENKTTDENIAFRYSGVKEKDGLGGRFIAQYNDKMHVLLERSTITDIINIVDRRSETNLLNRYLSDTSAFVTGMPIVDAFLTKDYLSLLNDYVRKVEFTENAILLTVHGTLFGEKDDPDHPCHDNVITVTLDTEKKTVQKIGLEGGYSDYRIQGNIEFKSFEEAKKVDILEYSEATKDKFIDMEGFKTLVKAGIATTEHSYFELSAELSVNLSIPVVSTDSINTHATCEMYIENQEVYAYLSFNNHNMRLQQDGFYGTEFFIHEKEVYMTLTCNQKGKLTSSLKKMTQKEVLRNLLYYVTDYILDLSDMEAQVLGFISVNVGGIVLGNIYGQENENNTAEKKNVLNRDFSSFVKQAKYQDGTFALDMDVNSILGSDISNLVNVSSARANVQIDTKSYELTHANVSVEATAVSMIGVSFSLTMNRNLNATGDHWSSSRYCTFVQEMKREFGSFDDNSKLPEYQILSIKANRATGLLASTLKYSSITIEDNYSDGLKNELNFSYGEATRVFFFGGTRL